jgi:hypothetical protein
VSKYIDENIMVEDEDEASKVPVTQLFDLCDSESYVADKEEED